MTGAEIAILAVVGYFIYKSWKRKQIGSGVEDLGGGLSDTDIEGFVQPMAEGRAHPVVMAKPTGLQGDQESPPAVYKTNDDLMPSKTRGAFSKGG